METVFIVGLIFIVAFLLRYLLIGMGDVFEAARIYIKKNKKESEENERH